jgi:hypothetical protein
MPAVTYIPDIVEHSVTVPVAANHETAGVEIRLPAHPEFRLRVTLSDGTGRVPPGAKVKAYQPRTVVKYANPDGTFTVVYGPGGSVGYVDPDGTVSLGPLPPGPVTIFATILDDRVAARPSVDSNNGRSCETSLNDISDSHRARQGALDVVIRLAGATRLSPGRSHPI